MKSLKRILFIAVLSVMSNYVLADKWRGTPAEPIPTQRATELCEPGQTSTELGVNNVRALIHTAGDMWWDLQGKAYYIVPADGKTSALFAGAIWIGGHDANGQLKIAAQKFRQRGIDYWPGPLITSGPAIATVTQDICREYDKHFHITKNIVKEFREWFACTQDPECDTENQFPGYSIPDIIMNWPAHGPEGGYDYNLAPFWDVDGDGYYNPLMGDFPYYEFVNNGITDDPDCIRPRNRAPKLFGDETLWWVYNDKGNIHTETGGASIGMEFRAQAFAFTTNDELNDMTFYNYNIINRSTYTLYDTYFGVWTDADLGNPKDDFCGCDVLRGLGYMYNGDNYDETADGIEGYGEQPPAIGIDFFEGPYQDPDGKDNSTSFDTINGVKVLNCERGNILNGNINGLNFEDGVVDNERWGMRRFLYFNNWGTGDNPATLDPVSAIDHYNYITGFWLDNTPLCYGGTGHYSGGADTDMPTDFMFPGTPTTDPCGWGQGGIPQGSWSEEEPNGPGSTPNSPRDVRFVQSAGPFTLYPGAVNDITIGAVYARAPSGGPWASVEAVRKADDKAQILFENCFRVLNGPDAPELKIIEMDKRLIFHIYNKAGSNNYLEAYIEKDPAIVCTPDIDPCDDHYRFQGYQVFQYKKADVSISDRYNDALVREAFQCDIKDDIVQIVNYKWSDELGANVPVEEVNGNNKGIIHTFVLDNDLFASGDPRLINNREYYYSVIAYGYNNSLLYNQSIQETFNGQKSPYLAGRNNIRRYTAIPHINDPENGGTIIQGDYGYGPEITMIEGHGNGNNILELTQETIDEIMSGSPWKATSRTYKNSKGPIQVKIIDPLNVPEDTYTLKFDSTAIARPTNGFLGHRNGSSLVNRKDFVPFHYTIANSKGDKIESEVFIQYIDDYEHLFMDWGFSITIKQVNYAGYCNKNDYQNGVLSSSMKFEDETKPWLYFVPDGEGQDALNWIRVGTQTTDNRINECLDISFDDYTMSGGEFYDKYQNFEKILGGTWAPFMFTSHGKYGLSDKTLRAQLQPYSHPISSVKLVITSDKSKWSRSCVVEMCENEWTVDAKCGLPIPVSPKANYRSIGNAFKFTLRKSPSVDKNGNPLDDGTHGLGWFPGYAIDVSTGERLNIVFGEDSWMSGENGADMIWNPSSYPNDNYATGLYSDLGPRFGGKHYIYIMRNDRLYSSSIARAVPAYDSCQFIYDKLMRYEDNNYSSTLDFQAVWKSAMWCAMPIKRDGYDLLATDVTINLNVSMPYHKGKYVYEIENPQNDNNPMFTFNTADVKTIKSDNDQAVSALDLIRVVPNPYYGNSYYENNQLDNYVRITNLPSKCVVSIFNANGGLVRRYDKDSESTFIQWDMKNAYGISIASGVYIVHINAPGVGEKIVKWFGALRPIDLNNF